MKELSRYEKAILGLGLSFLLVTAGYRMGGTGGRPYVASVARNDQPAVQIQSSAANGSRPDSLLEGERIDVNRADWYDLQRLPGIGEKKARAILDWREEHGAFTQPEQLLEISGIGEKTLDSLRPYITLGEAAEGGDYGEDPGGG